MTDRSLAEVLRSPLDDLPKRTEVRPWLAFGLAAVVGAALTAVALPAESTPLEQPVSVPSTTLAPATPKTLVLEDGTTLDQIAWWDVEDGAAVLVTASSAPGVAPAEANPVISAQWEVVLSDGRVVPGTTFADVGVSMIEFTAPGATFEQFETIRFRPPIEVTERSVTWEEAAVGFPWSPQVSGALSSIGEASIHIDTVRFDDMGGEVVWHIEGDERFAAQVDVEVAYRESDQPERIVSRFGLPTAFLQFDGHANPPTADDTLELYHLDDPDEPTFRSRFWGDPDPVDVTDVVVTWTIVFAEYASEPIEAPVERS